MGLTLAYEFAATGTAGLKPATGWDYVEKLRSRFPN